jgi:hypothetical protein
MDINFIFALCLASAGLALTYSVLYRQTNLGKRVSAVIAVAFGVIVLLFLQQNPDILQDSVAKIALAVVGAVIAVAVFVRRNATK